MMKPPKMRRDERRREGSGEKNARRKESRHEAESSPPG